MTEDRFLSGREPREDRPAVTWERPEGYEPLLVSNQDELTALYLAASLMTEVSEMGGTVVSPTTMRAIRRRIAESLPEDILTLLAEELQEIASWLDDRLPDEETNPDVSFVRGSGAERWRSIVKYAVESECDLRGEYYDPESETWPVVLGTPLFFDDDSVVLERLDGIFVTVLFRDTRWLMPVRQKRKRELADVLPFRGSDSDE